MLRQIHVFCYIFFHLKYQGMIERNVFHSNWKWQNPWIDLRDSFSLVNRQKSATAAAICQFQYLGTVVIVLWVKSAHALSYFGWEP